MIRNPVVLFFFLFATCGFGQCTNSTPTFESGCCIGIGFGESCSSVYLNVSMRGITVNGWVGPAKLGPATMTVTGNKWCTHYLQGLICYETTFYDDLYYKGLLQLYLAGGTEETWNITEFFFKPSVAVKFQTPNVIQTHARDEQSGNKQR
jgi:hypothetical protein